MLPTELEVCASSQLWSGWPASNGLAEFTGQKQQQVHETQQISEKTKQHSAAVGPGPLESCSNWRCSHPDSLCCGDCALSAGPALSLGFVFHALRSRTNWVSVSFYCVAHYPRERLKSVLSQADLHNTTNERMSVHCAHCLIKILDTQKLLTTMAVVTSLQPTLKFLCGRICSQWWIKTNCSEHNHASSSTRICFKKLFLESHWGLRFHRKPLWHRRVFPSHNTFHRMDALPGFYYSMRACFTLSAHWKCSTDRAESQDQQQWFSVFL